MRNNVYMNFQHQIINYHYSQIPLLITELYNLQTSPENYIRNKSVRFFDSLLLLANHETENLKHIREEMLPKIDESHKRECDGNKLIIPRPRLERDFGIHPPLNLLPESHFFYIDDILYIRECLREQYQHYQLYCFDLSLDCAYMRNTMIKMELALRKDKKKRMHRASNTVLQHMIKRYISLAKEFQTYLRILKSYRYEFADEYDFPAGHHVHERYYGIKATFPLFVV